MSREPDPADGGTIRLELYIAGTSIRSGTAVSSVRKMADEALGDRYELEIIDVMKEPDRAESARILTTPTVIKVHPLPQRRVTGDLSRRPEVLAALAPGFSHSIPPHRDDA